jgi:hypothetical protein
MEGFFHNRPTLLCVLWRHAGFLSYEDFQSQALGVGAAVSAVTGLFWVAVLLLVRPRCCFRGYHHDGMAQQACWHLAPAWQEV